MTQLSLTRVHRRTRDPLNRAGMHMIGFGDRKKTECGIHLSPDDTGNRGV